MKNDWIDITIDIRPGMVHWPGDIDIEFSRPVSMESGQDANVTNIKMSAHTGTHVDAPLHFINDGRDVSSFSLDLLIGPARVIYIKNKKQITLEEILPLNIKKGDRLLFKTANSEKDWGMLPFIDDYIFLSTDAAKYLTDAGVLVVGVDYLSVAGEENGLEVHRMLLGKEILIIEGLKLNNVDPGDYEMVCLPLKLAGADGAPARVVIRKRN